MPYTHWKRYRRIASALEDLGATFIKLGQILSTRPDLLSSPYLDEFAELQDAAPPVPTEAVAEVIASSLGRPVEELSARYDADPTRAPRLS